MRRLRKNKDPACRVGPAGAKRQAKNGTNPMNCQDHLYRKADPALVTRRWFFRECGVGLGAIALGSLFRQTASGGVNPLVAKQPHYAAKAKRVIFLFMAGAPSHLELFDHKPQLARFDGTLPPPDLIKGYR